MTKLLTLNEKHIPKLPRHAKLRFDQARNIWIINAPERGFELDDIAAEIIKMVDGKSQITIIIDKLLKKFEVAPREIITKDVLALLQPLAD